MTLFREEALVIAGSLLLLLTCSAPAQTQPPPALGPSPSPSARKPTHAPGGKHAAAKPSPIPAPAPQPPPVPLTPEQMPPAPPQVSYRNGLLTIVATNSTLDDILRAVSARTGATVDAPAQLTGERVAARLGPGNPREVLSDLLRGPRFDYILLGSDGDPNAVRSIILTPNRSSPTAPATVAQVPPQARPVTPPQEDEEEVVEEQQLPPIPEVSPVRQGSRHRPPYMPPDQTVGQPGASPENPQPQEVKTPEQLLQELRKLQQQRQSER